MDAEAYHLIEQYLNNDLDASEKEAFQHRLDADPDFADAFETYKAINAGLHAKENREAGEEALRQNLDEISNDFFTEDKSEKRGKVISLKRMYWAAAASVVLILGAVFFFSQQETTALYTQYAGYEPLTLAERGQHEELRSLAETSFNNGEYEKAADALSKLTEQNPENTELKLYLSIAWVEINRFDQAAEVLKEIKNGGSIFRYKAIWYLALSYLKQDKIDACKSALKEIPESSPEYDSARQLLKEL